ncbi:hypothetical protein [Vagococcus carniphilus]|uniref:Flagellar protein FliT n=1 Tax=Vagococcus carniphilus TaxID=218144 RepID=A0A430B4W4_9ENTE|nr:hypothetical protein [Vagococcus carniphilus]MDT2865059.1 hypothetical protein [Vagococcus carniphilus]QNN71799.1 hypothetical protein H9L18_07810 [Vagococcus carniphilus]RSU15365.1 hypothetical protein CBF28_06475 [Vagococcus carniphilus]
MLETTKFSEYLVQEMLRNVLSWDGTTDEAFKILNENDDLMKKYQSLSEKNLSEMENCRLEQLLVKTRRMTDYLSKEKNEFFNKINQLNQAHKIRNQYVYDFSDSYFIDKDF